MCDAKWCNFLRKRMCAFTLRGDHCKYMHVDDYVEMEREERMGCGVQSLMERHAKDLKEAYSKDIEEAVERGRMGWDDVAVGLAEVGWTNRTSAVPLLFFRMILKLVIYTLHYDIHGAAEIMFHTISFIERSIRNASVPSLEIPVSTPPTPFSESHDPISPIADSEETTSSLHTPYSDGLIATYHPPPVAYTTSQSYMSYDGGEDIDEEQVAMYLMAI